MCLAFSVVDSCAVGLAFSAVDRCGEVRWLAVLRGFGVGFADLLDCAVL